MAERNINDRIGHYIEKIEPVNEGGRNNLLHNTGLLLRKNFGLQGDALIEWLHFANRQKCAPALSDADVVKVARSVDQSNVPLGENSGTYTPPNRRKAQKQTMKRHAVDIAESPVAIAELLTMLLQIYFPYCTMWFWTVGSPL